MTLLRQLAELPVDRVVQVLGAGPDAIASTAAEGLGDLAPVVVGHATCATPSRFVRAIMDDLERVAVALLPGWLPEAAEINRPDPAGLAAARAAAVARAHHSPHFAPFLSELAVVALTGKRAARSEFSIETRSLGLARVVAEGFGRRRLVLLIQVPPGLTPDDERTMVSGAGWLAHHGKLGVWLVGAPLREIDQVPTAQVTSASSRPGVDSARAAVTGKPHPASAIEATLEAALAAQSWAVGRMWNQTYQSHTLTAPMRLDLFWPAERCVVELDGPEHCHPVRFEADRQRDVQLQLDGCAVLRFTNARIRHDVGAVVHQIGTYLQGQRRDIAEGRDHGQRG